MLEKKTSLVKSDDVLHSAFDCAPIGTAIVTPDGQFLNANRAFITIFGYSYEELLIINLLTLMGPNERILNHQMRLLLKNERMSFKIEIECHHHIQGKMVWVQFNAALASNETTEVKYFVIQCQDITERRHIEQQLIYTTHHDLLTGLINSDHFLNQLNLTFISARRYNTQFALLFIGLDQFGLVNDNHGHFIGDQLLRTVGERLNKTIRTNDLLVRINGDKFIILLAHIKAITDVARIAQKPLVLLSEPYILEGNEIKLTASVGVSVYPGDCDNSHFMLMHAEKAMYLAKERGRNNFQFYLLDMTDCSKNNLHIEDGLRDALNNMQFKLHYQPQINAANGKAESVEALLRWQYPELGLLLPEHFIAIAEATGLIVPIGLWAIRAACLQLKKWQEFDGPFSRMRVNISPRQFQDDRLYSALKAILSETKINPNSLELEITESAIMQDSERILPILKKISSLGVQLSIDDFGSGFFNFSYLKQLPVQSIKMDRSFAQQAIDVAANNVDDIRAIITMAHGLNLQVTAKGVETIEQLDFFRVEHCDGLQGDVICKASTANQLESDFDVHCFSFAKPFAGMANE